MHERFTENVFAKRNLLDARLLTQKARNFECMQCSFLVYSSTLQSSFDDKFLFLLSMFLLMEFLNPFF